MCLQCHLRDFIVVCFPTDLYERENHTSYEPGKMATNCGRAVEFSEPYFFVLMVQICTFVWFSTSLEWATSKRDILCGSERTSALTICKLRGEELRGNVFYIYCSLCIFCSQLHSTCIWFLKDGITASRSTTTLCEYILLHPTRIWLSTILRLCRTGVTVAVQSVLSGPCNGPDCCKTDTKEGSAFDFPEFSPVFFFLWGEITHLNKRNLRTFYCQMASVVHSPPLLKCTELCDQTNLFLMKKKNNMTKKSHLVKRCQKTISHWYKLTL